MHLALGKHGLKIILVLLLAVAALLVLNLQPQAAGPEPDTQALNEVAAAISENAQVIQDYVDSIDVSEIRGIRCRACPRSLTCSLSCGGT